VLLISIHITQHAAAVALLVKTLTMCPTGISVPFCSQVTCVFYLFSKLQ